MNNEKGSVTVLLSLLAAVILSIGLGFNWLVKEHIRTAESLREKSTAIVKARSAYDTLIYLVLTGLTRENGVYLDEKNVTPLHFLPLDGTEIRMAEDVFVRIQESNGRLSLTTVNPDALQRLAGAASNGSTAALFAASFLDWTDRDDLVRLNGAEARYYKGQGAPYTQRNYEIQYLAELAFIRGMNADLYQKVIPSLTMLPTTGFNPNTASDAVLKAFLNINDSGLSSIRNYLKHKTIKSKEELFRLTGKTYEPGRDQRWFFPSKNVDVIVSVGSPRSLYRIKAGLSTGQGLFYPYFIHYWQEE